MKIEVLCAVLWTFIDIMIVGDFLTIRSDFTAAAGFVIYNIVLLVFFSSIYRVFDFVCTVG